jgi:riboflavin synthase
MFTGLVEETGIVHGIIPGTESIRLSVRARLCATDVRVGDSIAVNGCCLTVVTRRAVRGGALLGFDLLKETWDRTSISVAALGAKVNLERSLSVGQRLGGHFVTGHVDGTGKITAWERRGMDQVLEISAPREIRRYIVLKGSIAVDGISLTVAAETRGGFRLWIIPHTFEVTALKERVVGDRVNLEADMLGKYVERFVRSRR